MEKLSNSDSFLLDGKQVDIAAVDAAQSRTLSFSEHECLAFAFEARMQAYGDRACLGWRLGEEYHWMSYRRFFQHSRQVGRALLAKLQDNACVGICGANCLEWFIADFACLWAGLPTVPLSDSWDIHTLEAVLEKTEIGVVFCEDEQLHRFQTVRHDVWVIVLGDITQSKQSSETLAIPSNDCFDSLKSLMDASWPDLPVSGRPSESVHTILHTSGTTGEPKGVVYTDGLWKANMIDYPGLNVGYSYMPLAFITDRHTVYTALWNGGRVGIRAPGSTDEIFKDLQHVRPTVLKGVPSFFEKVKSAAQFVHDRSLELLGGRCAVLICGAGALDESVGAWFRDCISHDKKVSFLEMYGGTECGNIAVNRKLQPHVDYKLLPYGDMPSGYGELVVKTGANMFARYHKDPERTAAAFTSDGFYKIGDVVHIEDGRVNVIGRAKTSIKLGNGKWVFPESLETLYRSQLRDDGVQHVFVHGDASHDMLIAIIDTAGKADANELLVKMRNVAQSFGKKAYECVSAVVLAKAPFSLEAGTLNGTGKLDRQKLVSLYKEEIKEQMEKLSLDAAASALARFDSSKSFVAQGGTSLQASRIAQLYLEFGIPISRVAKLLLSDMPVKAVVDNLTTADPFEDALLELPQPRGEERSVDSCVFLTGATGFLGRTVLAELLERGMNVISLVRCQNEIEGKQRLKTALRECGRWKPSYWPRILVHAGSLSAPFDPAALRAHNVSTVFHAAAAVNLKESYTYHRSANVLGTYHILNFAAAVGARVIFVSTTDTYLSKDEAISCKCEPSPDILSNKKHGYAASKAVGEMLVARALKLGVSGVIARLGMVSGDTVTGYCTPTDFAMRLLISFAHTKAFPVTTDEHTMVHSVPVDVAAAALVDVAVSQFVGACNVVSGAPFVKMTEIKDQLARFDAGLFGELLLQPFPEWMKALKAEGQLSGWPVLAWAADLPEFPVFNTRHPTFHEASWARPQTLASLKRGTDEACLHKMLRFTFKQSSGTVPSSSRSLRSIVKTMKTSVK